MKALCAKPLTGVLRKYFGVGAKLIRAYFYPCIYLDHKLIAKKGLNKAEIEKVLALELTKLDGVLLAISSSQLTENRLTDNMLTRAIINNYNEKTF